MSCLGLGDRNSVLAVQFKAGRVVPAWVVGRIRRGRVRLQEWELSVQEKNPTVLTVDVEKNVEIKYDETDSTPSFIQVGTPTMPTMPLPPPRVHGGDGQQADTDNSHAQQGPYPGPRDARKSIRIETDRGNYRSAGVHPASQANTGEPVVPQHRRNASGGLEGDIHGPASGLESPSFHPFATATPVSPNTRQARPSSILIIGHHANHTHPPWPRSGENGGGSDSGAHWTESNQ